MRQPCWRKAVGLHAWAWRRCGFGARSGARNKGGILALNPLPHEIDRGRWGQFLRCLLARALVARCVVQRSGCPALTRDPFVFVVAPYGRRCDREARLGSTSPGWRWVSSTTRWCSGHLLPWLQGDGAPRPGDVHPRIWLSDPTVNNLSEE